MKSHIPFPKTRLEDYLEYKKEISAQENIAGIRYEVFQDETSRVRIKDNLKNKIDEIFSRYEQLLHPEDIHSFNYMDELKSFLKEDLELKEYKIKEIIRHEKQHINKIYELGYFVKGFGCILLKTKKNKMTYAVITMVDSTRTIPYNDLVAIISAPNKTSITDNYHLGIVKNRKIYKG